jgi:hypothetical protein
VIVFEYAVGGTIGIELDAESVDSGVVATAAALRRLNYDRSDFRDGAPSIPMTITPRAAAGNFPAGWRVTLAAAAAAALEPGYYGANAWFQSGAGAFPTEMVMLRLRKTA